MTTTWTELLPEESAGGYKNADALVSVIIQKGRRPFALLRLQNAAREWALENGVGKVRVDVNQSTRSLRLRADARGPYRINNSGNGKSVRIGVVPGWPGEPCNRVPALCVVVDATSLILTLPESFLQQPPPAPSGEHAALVVQREKDKVARREGVAKTTLPPMQQVAGAAKGALAAQAASATRCLSDSMEKPQPVPESPLNVPAPETASAGRKIRGISFTPDQIEILRELQAKVMLTKSFVRSVGGDEAEAMRKLIPLVREFGIYVKTVVMQGWKIDAIDKQRLKKLLEECQPSVAAE